MNMKLSRRGLLSGLLGASAIASFPALALTRQTITAEASATGPTALTMPAGYHGQIINIVNLSKYGLTVHAGADRFFSYDPLGPFEPAAPGVKCPSGDSIFLTCGPLAL